MPAEERAPGVDVCYSRQTVDHATHRRVLVDLASNKPPSLMKLSLRALLTRYGSEPPDLDRPRLRPPNHASWSMPCPSVLTPASSEWTPGRFSERRQTRASSRATSIRHSAHAGALPAPMSSLTISHGGVPAASALWPGRVQAVVQQDQSRLKWQHRHLRF